MIKNKRIIYSRDDRRRKMAARKHILDIYSSRAHKNKYIPGKVGRAEVSFARHGLKSCRQNMFYSPRPAITDSDSGDVKELYNGKIDRQISLMSSP